MVRYCYAGRGINSLVCYNSSMVSFFSRPKRIDELALVFDIGSSSVGGAIFLTRPKAPPKIICSFREPILAEKKLSFDRFFALTLKSLDTVALEILKMGRGAPARIFCVLSSPWYISQPRTIRLEKNTPFVFNSKLADGLIQKEIALFREEHAQMNQGSEEKWKPIEFKNLKTVLNGYPTANPYNQKTKELEMTMFISMSPEAVLKKIEETIAKHFHFKEIRFSSFVIASFAVVRDMFVHQEEFLLIDIGGEVTDISLVKENTLGQSISFPLGPNFLLRSLAEETGCTLSEAASIISLYKDGHAESGSLKKLDPMMNKLKTRWLSKFQESLANLSSDISIPSTIFIAVDKEFASFFREIIQSEQFNQYTLTQSKFQIIFLDAGVFHNAAFFNEEAVRDPFLIIEAIYINRFLY